MKTAKSLLLLTLLLLVLAQTAEPAVLLAQQPLKLRQGETWRSPIVALAPQTERIVVSVRRPTPTQSVTWDAATRLRVRISLRLDGQEFFCEGFANGGLVVIGTRESAQYRLTYTPPWGFFGARTGFTKRLGETGSTYTASVTVQVMSGTPIQTTVTAQSTIAPAERVPFRSSVAFDAASSAEDTEGDSVSPLSWSHTASGTDRAVFIGSSAYQPDGYAALHNFSATYAGNAATELWDAGGTGGPDNDDQGTAGYRLIESSVPTGAQTVSVSWTSTGGNPGIVSAAAISMTGVHQTTPVGTAVQGSSLTGNPSVTVSDAASGDLVVDGMIVWTSSGGSVSVGANQTNPATLQQSWDTGTNVEFARWSYQAGADGGVMSWTITNLLTTNGWVQGAVAFKPAEAGGAGGGTTPLRNLLGVGQ